MKFLKRDQHEKRYDSWTETDSHGRIYHKKVIANNKSNWKAVYLQEVDKGHITLMSEAENDN